MGDLEVAAWWPADLEVRRRGGGGSLRGSFSYGRTATVASRGRMRKETTGPYAFGWQSARFAELQEELGDVLEYGLAELEDAAAASQRADAPGAASGVAALVAAAKRVAAGPGAPPRLSPLLDELHKRDTHLLVGHNYGQPLASSLAGTLTIVDTAEAWTFEARLPPEGSRPSWMADAVTAVEAGLVGGLSPGFAVPPASAVPNAEELEPEPGNPGVTIRRINHAVLFEMSLVTRPAYAETTVDLRDAPAPAPEPRRRGLWL